MNDITKAQFPNRKNVAGEQTFSYAELLAQLSIDLAGVSGTEGEIVSFDAANDIENAPAGAAGEVLTANASGIPTFQASGSAGAGNIGLGAQIVSGAEVVPSDAATILAGIGTVVNYDDFGFATGGLALTIPVAPVMTRVNLFGLTLWESNAVGSRQLQLRKNGLGFTAGGAFFNTVNAIGPSIGGSVTCLSGYSATLKVVPGDVFQLMVVQSSGAPRTIFEATMGIVIARNTG